MNDANPSAPDGSATPTESETLVSPPAPDESSTHLLLVFMGASLRALPLAIILILASQLVTWFRVPLITSCLIGVGTGAIVAFLGTMTDLLSRAGSDKVE